MSQGTITAGSAQQLILYELGAQLPGGGPVPNQTTQQQMQALAQLIGIVWQVNAPWQTVGDLLQYYMTKRQCCELLLGQVRAKINGSIGGLTQQLGQYFDHLQAIQLLTQQEIDRRLARARASRPAVIGTLLRQAPVDVGMPFIPPDPSQPQRARGGWPFFIDPNSPVLEGFPWTLLWGQPGYRDFVDQSPNLS